MKRVNVIYGILERLNDLLGSANSGDSETLDLTDWSIQSTMFENLKRIGKGLSNGSNDGKIGYGLKLDTDGNVSEGVGFTGNGEIVYWSGEEKPELTTGTGNKLYLKYTSEKVSSGGRLSSTSTMEKYKVGAKEQVVIDNSIDPAQAFTDTQDSSGDLILIATYDQDPDLENIVPAPSTGFMPAAPSNGLTQDIELSTVTHIKVENGIITGTTPVPAS